MALGLSLAKECFSVDDVSLTFKPSVHRFIIVRSRRILERKEMICGWNIRDGRCFLISSPQLLDGQGRKARQWAICFFFLRHIFQNFCGSKMLRNVCYHKVVICSLRNASSFPITFCFESRSAFFHFFFILSAGFFSTQVASSGTGNMKREVRKKPTGAHFTSKLARFLLTRHQSGEDFSRSLYCRINWMV